MTFTFVNAAIELVLDLRVYRLAAIQKAAHRLADRFTAVLGSPTNDSIQISLQFKASTTEAIALDAARLFHQELLDQELREKIAEETAPVRALILAHAYSKTDLIKRD